MKKSISEFAKNFLLMVAGLCFALIMLEVFLRVLGNPFGFRIKGDQIVLPAHQKYEIHNTTVAQLDELIIHEKNSLGFRGAEPPTDFDANLTLVTVGGSTTECFYLSEGQTWTDGLGLLLEDNFSPLWINNAGLDGHSTYGHIVLMEDYLIQLQPKVILFLVGANDMGLGDAGAYDRGIEKNTNTLPGLLKSASGHSEVAALLYNLARFVITRQQDIGHGSLDTVNLPALEISEQAKEAALQMHRQQYLSPYQSRLEQLIALARENGIKPVLITQPALYGNGVDPETGIDWGRIAVKDLDGETQWEILELYNDVTRQVGVANDVLVIDLADELQKDSNYYYDMLHFTPAGAQRVAQIIYTYLCPSLSDTFGLFQTGACAETAN
ncbi:MAG: SGNH/GDSL hydrolase family protein [Chloroflexi bacterium]|nr:SGNH/GDSL hydrolase family protein [Chloroflexota bacterium]